MQRKNLYRIAFLTILIAAFTVSCTRYEQKIAPLELPAASPNMIEVAGAQIVAKAFDTKKEAEEAFGFDIIGSGVLPVQVVFDHKGTNPLEIVSDRAFMVDADNKLWPVLDSRMVYDRIEKKTELGEVAPKAAKYGALGGIAGGLIGAAIGIVSGHNVGDAAMKGAAMGAASGAVIGGTTGLDNSEAQRSIREDMQSRSMQNRSIRPKEISYGYIFFPGEAKQGKELRLTIKETGTGNVHPLILNLEKPAKK